jgi:hypothetical protein
LELHNETGYQSKPINVAKAVLYSLMPRGSLVKVPDSLWQSYIYASLLAGSALRGCKVLIYAPSLASAPSNAGPTMARAHGLFSALVYFANEMEGDIRAEGGLFKIGLYAPRSAVGDLRGRILQARSLETPWLREVYPANPAIQAVLDSLDYILDAAGYESDYLVASDTTERPKLHLKANFFITDEAWQALIRPREWGPLMHEYVEYMARMTGPADQRPDVREMPQSTQAAVIDLVRAVERNLPADQRERVFAYLTVGSANMDYRSMVMDGEVMVTVSGWDALPGLLDFIMLVGLCEWIDTQEELDALLPPPGGMTRKIANLMKLAL